MPTGHDLTQAMLGLLIALVLWHLRAHNKIERDLADLRPKVQALWHRYIRPPT